MAIVTQQENKINKLEYFEFETHPENAAVKDTVTGKCIMLCMGEEEKLQGKLLLRAANNFDKVLKTLEKAYTLIYEAKEKEAAEWTTDAQDIAEFACEHPDILAIEKIIFEARKTK